MKLDQEDSVVHVVEEVVMELLDLRVIQDNQDHLVLLEKLDHKVLKDQEVLLEHQEHQEIMEKMEDLDSQVID